MQRGEIPRRDVGKILREGTKIVVEHLLPGGGQGGKGAPVEGVDQRNDLAAVCAVGIHAVFARRLDGTLVGFGARIAEKHRVQPGARAKRLRQGTARLGVVQVGGVLQRCRLFADGGDPRGVAVPQRIYADAGGKIQIAPPLGVGGVHSLPRHQRQRAAVVGVQDVGIVAADNFSCGHTIPLLFR